jgi:hypothetical protein
VKAIITEYGSTTKGERLTIVQKIVCQCWEQETNKVIIFYVKVRMNSKNRLKKSNENGEDKEEELMTDNMVEYIVPNCRCFYLVICCLISILEVPRDIFLQKIY